MGKGENAGNHLFLLFPECFMPSQNKFKILSHNSNAMFEASSVYFQCVNEQAAHVKIDHVSR